MITVFALLTKFLWDLTVSYIFRKNNTLLELIKNDKKNYANSIRTNIGYICISKMQFYS